MGKNKKNIAEQALKDMDKIQEELKNSSEGVISSILSEATKSVIREKINGPEEDDEDDYDVLDAETESEDEKDAKDGDEDGKDKSAFAEEPDEEDGPDPEEGSSDEKEDGDDDDEWSEFEDYKTGDDEYDFTGEKDNEKIVRVYKLLKDTDNVVVKKDGDMVKIQDNETGANYVIDLDDVDDEDSEDASDPVVEVCIKEEGEDGLTDQEREWEEEEDPTKSDNVKYLRGENKKSRRIMKENNEMLIEVDLGYTDNYQDKDPIQGLSNGEPSKTGKSWHKGVPTGTEKPWAGNAKSQGAPYGKAVKEGDEPEAPVVEEEVDEEIEESVIGGRMGSNRRGIKKVHSMQNAETPEVPHKESKNGVYKESIEKDLKKALKENKEVKEALLKMKGALQEALLVNVNLGQFVKLVTENTTSQDEKVEILNRFSNEAKTVEQSKALYESIRKDLNKGFQKASSINEGTMSVNEGKSNETEIYQSDEMLHMIDFMKRMENC